jgi:hypothetical protein
VSGKGAAVGKQPEIDQFDKDPVTQLRGQLLLARSEIKKHQEERKDVVGVACGLNCEWSPWVIVCWWNSERLGIQMG